MFIYIINIHILVYHLRYPLHNNTQVNKNVQSQLLAVLNIIPDQKYIVEKDTNSYTLLKINLWVLNTQKSSLR